MDRIGSDRRFTIDLAIGFVIPLGIFLEIGSPILLATSELTEDGFFIPLSLAILPVSLILYMFRKGEGDVYPRLLTNLICIFSVYTIIMAMISAIIHEPQALLYGMQWAMIFVWFPYFGTLSTRDRFIPFLQGFVWGVIVNLLYYLTSGVLEIVQYGGLQDDGRMSQNLVLVGQYQILVYVPTLVAYSVALTIILRNSGVINISRKYFIFIIISSISVLIFLASREAVVVMGAFGLAYLIMKGGVWRFVGVISAISSVLLIFSIASFSESLRETDFRLFDKFANLSDEDARLGGRDDMIEGVSQVIKNSPVFGSYFLPPNSDILGLKVRAPSAHNMYVDAFVWSGIFGGSVFLLICIYIFFMAINRINPRTAVSFDRLGRNTGLLVAIFLIVSNNINVPMRAPLISPMFSLLVFICSYWYTDSKQQS